MDCLSNVLAPLLQLRNHPVNIQLCLPTSLRSQLLQCATIFSFQRFFTSFSDQTALDPHLNAVGDRLSRAFRNEQGRNLSVACAEYLIEKWLKNSQRLSHVAHR